MLLPGTSGIDGGLVVEPAANSASKARLLCELKHFGISSEQLDIPIAMAGNRAATAQFEQLRSRDALAGRLDEVYDALTYPFDPERTSE